MSEAARNPPAGRAAAIAAARVGAGLAGCVVLARWSPLPAGDPLRGTLTALPLVLGLLAAASRRRPDEPASSAPALEAAALASWIGLVLAGPALALAGAERVLAVGGFLLLGLHLARRLVRLARELSIEGSAPPARATAARLFLIALATYTALLPWSTSRRPPDGDEPWYLLTAHSLAQDLDTDLADEYRDEESRHFLDRALGPQPGDPRGPEGQIYSRHDPLLPLWLAPFYAAAGKHGALFAMALLAAAAVACWWPLAQRTWPELPRSRVVQWALLALAPPFLLYTHQLWVEVPAALLVVLALFAIRELEHRGRGRWWIVLAGSVLALPALKLRFAALAGPLLALAFLRLPRGRRVLLAVASAGAATLAALLVHNRQAFGNALRIHAWEELLLHRFAPSYYLSHFLGLFFDVAFGLFSAAPIWMILVPGLYKTLRAGGHEGRRLLVDTSLLSLPYLVLVASRREWFGGWSPPFRYLLALLPVLGLVTIPAWSDLRHRRARVVVAALWLATLALLLVFLATPGLAYNFADGRSRLLDLWSARLGLDLAALSPSGVRLRAATWWVPALVIALLVASWPGPRRKREATSPSGARSTGSLLLLGAACALVAAAAFPSLAATVPTRRIEVESPHVIKTGGQPDPDLWLFDRRRYPEAWVLPEGASARSRVRAAGDLVALRVVARGILNHPGVLALELACDDRLLVSLRLSRHDVWEERVAGPVPWEEGCDLVVSVPETVDRPAGATNGVAIDRVDLDWR